MYLLKMCFRLIAGSLRQKDHVWATAITFVTPDRSKGFGIASLGPPGMRMSHTPESLAEALSQGDHWHLILTSTTAKSDTSDDFQSL
jgi:hypothetical protein